jgi:hypothetical protein
VLSVRADLSRLRSALGRWRAAAQRSGELRAFEQQAQRRRLALALLAWREAVRSKAGERLQVLRAMVWHARRAACRALRTWALQAAAGALRAEAAGRKMGRLRLLQCLRVRRWALRCCPRRPALQRAGCSVAAGGGSVARG